MSQSPHRQEREELNELLTLYGNLRAGRAHSYIDEEGFEKLIDYFDDQDQLNDALEASEYAINQFPYSSNLLIKRADVLIASRQYYPALECLQQVEVMDNSDINLYILKTDALLALDRHVEAAELLHDALERFDGEERLELLFELSDVYDDYEDFDAVFDCLKMVLEMDPLNEEALYKICFWTDFTGRNEEGIKLHQQILDEYPFSALAWFNLAAAYQGIKLYEKAIDAYQYAVAIDEKFDYAWRNMGDAYIRLRKYKDAIDVLSRVLELARPEDVIYEAIGHCYDKLKNFAQARIYYRKAVHLSPEDSQLHYKIAGTYMNEQRWESAIRNLKTALTVHRSQPEYNLALGQCLLQLGKVAEALQHLAQAVKSRPKNLHGWLALLQCLFQEGLYDEGLHYLQQALSYTNNKPVLQFYRVAFLIETGKTKEAVLQLEHALTIQPKSLKKLLELYPSIMQHQSMVEVIARHKKSRSI